MKNLINKPYVVDLRGYPQLSKRSIDNTLTDEDIAGWMLKEGLNPKWEETINQNREYIKKQIPPSIRWQVWERDNFTCKGCGVRRNLTVDHIIPEIKGGEIVMENLQTLCKSCNSRKGKT